MRRSRMDKEKGLTLANEKLLLRGAQIREVDLRVGKGGGKCIAHMTVSCDITKKLARRMKWEIYTGDPDDESDGHLISGLTGSTGLAGKIYLTQAKLSVNGIGAQDLPGIAATVAEGFSLSRAKGLTEDSTVTTLFFKVQSSAYEAIVNYFGLMGQADGVMQLSLQPEQKGLHDAQGDDDEDREDTEDEEGPAAAPEAPTAPKPRGRPRKAPGSSTITMEKV